MTDIDDKMVKSVNNFWHQFHVGRPKVGRFLDFSRNLANSDETLKEDELIEVLRISNLEMFRKLFLIIIRNSKYLVSTVYITLQPSDISYTFSLARALNLIQGIHGLFTWTSH